MFSTACQSNEGIVFKGGRSTREGMNSVMILPQVHLRNVSYSIENRDQSILVVYAVKEVLLRIVQELRGPEEL